MNRGSGAVRPFSDGYLLVDATLCEHSGDVAITSHDFHEELARHVTAPLVKVDGSRFWLEPEHAVPAETVALPRSVEDNGPILMAKDKTAERLLRSGEEEAPQFMR